MTTSISKPPVSVPPARRLGSETTTDGICVTVQPAYSALDSDPDSNQYRFLYRIRITNSTEHTVQLYSRRWVIVDANGQRYEVQGDGVVGQQPVLAPGHSFEYASFCPLGTPWGTMEGAFRMRRVGGGVAAGATGVGASAAEFEVQIGRFFLVCPPEEQVKGV